MLREPPSEHHSHLRVVQECVAEGETAAAALPVPLPVVVGQLPAAEEARLGQPTDDGAAEAVQQGGQRQPELRLGGDHHPDSVALVRGQRIPLLQGKRKKGGGIKQLLN